MDLNLWIALYPWPMAGAAIGALLLIVLSMILRAPRVDTGTSIGILSASWKLITARGRKSAVMLAVFTLLFTVSGLTWLIESGETLRLIADGVVHVLAVYTLHRLWLEQDAGILGARWDLGNAGSVFIRIWLAGIYAFAPYLVLLIVAAFATAVPEGWVRNAVWLVLGVMAAFATIIGTRATFMVPAAAIGRNPTSSEAFRLSRGVGLQLAGALLLIAAVTLVPVQLLSNAMNQGLIAILPASSVWAWIVYSVVDGVLLLLQIAFSIAAVSATFRDAILLKNGPYLPESEPESENAAP